MPDVYKYLTDVEVIRVNLTRRPHVLQEFERSIEYGRDTRIRMGF